MKKQIFFLFILLYTAACAVHAQETPQTQWTGPSVNFKAGKIGVSANGRYLVHKNGTPFFYLGDTAWELFHRMTEAEVEQYLENRRSKGFTVIQAVILAELDGLNTPNALGDLPLTDQHAVQPNEKYFKWVDKVIRMAEKKGLYIGLLPTWGDKVDKQWGTGPEIFNPMTAGLYGTWLGRRYKGFKNIIWIIGGDRWGGDGNYATWDALGKSIKKEDKNHLMTFHPQGWNSSSKWFHNCLWLDFNMAQTGHCDRSYSGFREFIVSDYNRQPVKPCLDGEPRYENHPVCWKPEEKGWFDDADVRQALYWDLFSGSCGHTYGCHDIWQVLDKGRNPVGHARGNWKTSMDLPGAFDLVHARRLMEAYDWSSRVPDPSMIASENEDLEHKIVALRGDGFAFVYFPNGEEATLDVSNVAKGQELTCTWMNPRTGERMSSASTAEKKTGDGVLSSPGKVQGEIRHSVKGTVHIVPPSSGRGNDWVLILEKKESMREK